MSQQTIRQYEFTASAGWKDTLLERLLIAICKSGVTVLRIRFRNVGMFSRKCIIQVTGKTDEFNKLVPSLSAHPADYGISTQEVLVTAEL